MAEKTGLSQNAIVRIGRAFGLQPHRVENFKCRKKRLSRSCRPAQMPSTRLVLNEGAFHRRSSIHPL
jgi:hypothetical protein